VSDDKAFPFPRGWCQAEQVTDKHAVGAGVGDEGEAITWLFDMPHGKFVLDSVDATLGQELIRTLVNALGEFTHRFAAFEAMPALERRATLLFSVGSFGFLGRTALPNRTTDLFQPWLNHFATALCIEDWSRGLTGAQERRDVHVVKVFVLESISEPTGLAVAARSEWRVILTETVAHPFRFGVTNESEMHALRLVVG